MIGITPSKLESLTALEYSLAQMMSRLKEILLQPSLTQNTFVEITAIYNNVAYAFLYLEANEEYEQFEHISHWRDAFYTDPELNERLILLLVDLHCPDTDAEESRVAYVKQLSDKANKPDDNGTDELDRHLERANLILAEREKSQQRLLDRIGIASNGVSANIALYQIISRHENPATRAKLARAWTVERDRHLTDLTDTIDRMVEHRRNEAKVAGFESVTARTLAKCDVTADEVDSFLQRYLYEAIDRYQILQKQVSEVVGHEGDPIDHFPYFMNTLRHDKSPLFVLDDCLRYICGIAEEVFGLVIKRLPSEAKHIITVMVSSDGREIGHINFDLWDTTQKKGKPNQTKGLRNRTNWQGVTQLPVAYVSCRFRPDHGQNRVNFQNVHSLFHEFGHGLNHLLIRRRLPNQSGLEYLPLERIEYLSMWFEKWAYHPHFAAALGLSAADREATQAAQRLKAQEYRRTYVQRALTAIIDFELHRNQEGGIMEVWHSLNARFGVAAFASVGDVAEYFTWPMYQANPGANFTYLWGSSDSCQKFAEFESLKIGAIADRPDLRELFIPSFDFKQRGPLPQSSASFDFYDFTALGERQPSGDDFPTNETPVST